MSGVPSARGPVESGPSTTTLTGLATGGRPRRGAELWLLGHALAVALLAYTAVGLATEGSVPAGLVGYGAGLGGLFLLAHLVVRAVAPYADPLLLPSVALLNGLGLVLISRLDVAERERAETLGREVPGTDAPLQLVWTALGVLLFVAVLLAVRDHTRLQRYTYTAGFAGVVLLLLPALPVLGRTVNGARLWLKVGPVQVQPSEGAKIALIIFFAGYLVAKRDLLALASRRVLGLDLPRGRDLGPVLLAWGVSLAVLVRGRDLGTSLLFFGIFIVMLYVATQRLSWLLIGLALFTGGAAVAYQLFGHVRQRVAIWLDPFADASGDGYQIVQGLFGFGSGGLTGTGLGQGRPETVPFAKTDFILATVGEELGLVGVMAVLVVYALVVQRGLRAALSCRDSFGKLLAAGLAFSLALQVFVVAGGVLRVIPLTGATLPFLSYGGSSLLANWVLVALLLRVSDAARRPSPGVVAPPAGPQTMAVALGEAPTQVVRR